MATGRITYRSGPKKGLPKFCKCGGLIEYTFSHGRVWSFCQKCTPVERIIMHRMKKKLVKPTKHEENN